MRFKYKVYIIVFTVLIMFIGFGTFSLVAPSIEFSNDKEVNTGNKDKEKKVETVSEKNDEKSKITDIVKGYFNAKQKVDMDAISLYVSDASKVDEKRLVTEAEYIEEYRNIECTIKETSEEGSYRVYVYYEVKIYDIDTLVPSLIALYLTPDDNGDYKIYLGVIDSEVQKSIDKLDGSDEVKAMTESVQKELENLISTNEDVRKFYQKLEATDASNEETEDNTDIDKEGSTSKTKSK